MRSFRLILILSFFPVILSAQLRRFQFSENKMGSPFIIIFYCNDSTEATELSRQCYAIVDSLNNIYSDYNLLSEIGRLASATGEQKVSDELFEMIMRSKQAWIISGKTFDITIGSLTQLWRKAKSENRFPTAAEVQKAKRSTGFKNLGINEGSKTITFKIPGMRFDFGGIVKGYAAQRVIDYLKTKNTYMALADAGGDMAFSETPPRKKTWSIGINLPESENEIWDKKLQLKNCAVATSGDVYRYTIHDGTKYSHIINPKTGYGVTSQRNVTVIAKDGTTADWLATACSILPIKKALRLAKKEKAALLIATFKDEKLITHKTKNFDSHFQESEG